MPERRKKKNLKSTKHHAVKRRKSSAAVAAKKPARPRRAKKVSKPKAGSAPAAAKTELAKKDSLAVHDLKGKSVDSLALDPLFRDGPVNTDVIYQAILMYRAGEREGTASTLDRGHVRGGGKKPWKQKGTGQARHGSRRSPLWRGGGTTFGPMPRDYSYALPREIRRRAVVEAVKDRFLNNKLVLVEQLELAAPKTRLVADLLEVFKLEKPLILVDQRSRNLDLASRNIRSVCVKTAAEVNALDLAGHKECLMTKAAYTGLVNRLKS